jgi:sulfur carrier protein
MSPHIASICGLPSARQRVKITVLHPLTRFPAMISITVNGETRQLEAPLNCAELLARLDLVGKRVALERNGEIVPRSQHASERLADGDRLEIVVAVGGG